MGFFNRLKESLSKTRQGLVEKIENLITGRQVIDESLYEELEEALIGADVGVETSLELMETLRRRVKEQKLRDPARLKPLLQELITDELGTGDSSLNRGGPPTVILVVGVNGVGKTTTIGKLAYYYKTRGERVLLGAADTFRAAAIDQLEIWGRRVGVDVVKHREGSDPAAVAYDALQAARARKVDMLIIDTAGRLHTKSNLMEELKKIRRVLGRELPGAPHEVLLVLDATTGQNAISQARLFSEATGVTGIVLTKLDGTARGGVIIGIRRMLNIPVKFIGIGEGVEDLQPFNPQEFAAALFD
ncbi:signal recognition particle-docking protein FtsY [Desulfofundulus thermocisternus]|uniref:signal recognition particle-docking protein FtsY n=1 Tax=Desulfofundulus thermocisternus TaxID=42471 RepID=UPI0019F71353|nr:signal recognition particle-docking protein FtsY [Desulfofundulus thermocisternus]MBE3585186.1 signal recognition particle-docking protein FtsY [Thermoanaerobacter sp.]MCS5696028.1 signal recognition particle-docking protein FtsY [Desulfofundulus thermocisternus]